MIKPAVGILCFLLCVWLFTLAGCDASDSKQLTVLYTGDTLGEIEYCGCSTEPIGGIARRASYIDSVRETQKNLLVVDTGNVFGLPDLMGRLKGDVILESMGTMAYDALNLGHNEFLFGSSEILESAKTNGVPAMSANVVFEDTNEPIATTSRQIEYDRFRVGVTGIVAQSYDADIVDSNTINERAVSVTEELAALQRETDQFRDAVDLVVVLANIGLEAAKDLARQAEGIDIIVVGHGVDITFMPMRINGVHIVKAGYSGQTVGRLDITLDDNNDIMDATGEIVNLEKAIEEDEAILAVLDEFHRSLIDYKDDLFDMEEKTPSGGGSYSGASACVSCHEEEYEKWQTTAHADAMASLEMSGQDYNPECVDCHVTGFNHTGGFKRPDLTPEMADLQCEVCHGAGQDHVESDGGLDDIEKPDELTCRTCHSGSHSPNFNYETYSQLIKH
jgi:hypothetical protein